MNAIRLSHLTQAVLLASTMLAVPNLAHAAANPPLATGQYVTPLVVTGAVQQYLNPGLAAYPNFVAGMAVRSQLSPDGTTLAVLTAGQNSLYTTTGAVDTANSTQYIFIYNVAGANKATPQLTQVIKQTNSHVGLVFSPDGNTLYAAGGNDDAVYVYTKSGGLYTAATPIALGHFAPGATGSARNKGVGLSVQPNAGGLGLSADGTKLVVANNYNDSISVIDTTNKTVLYEYDLRPYNTSSQSGGVGGTFPFAVVVKGSNLAYVSSARDREVVVLDISSASSATLVKRIALSGNALGMTFNADQSKLYVAEDNADKVAVIDTGTNTRTAEIDARAPAGIIPGGYTGTGAATLAVTLSRDGNTLYAVNAGSNSIAVINVANNSVTGLIPTAYEPHDITFSADGTTMYIVNGKSMTGPNRSHLTGSTGSLTSITYPGGNAAARTASRASNQYQFQLERATLVSAPVPTNLTALTNQVAQNNGYTSSNPNDKTVMDFLKTKITHVIYIVKENRTFDQVLGDLTNGANGDARLTQFGRRVTPNYHSLATQFVTLDNFMDPGDGSMDGWSWAMQGRVTNTETITQQINYAAVNRGLSYESEGANRNVPVNFPTVAERDAAAGPAGTTNYTNASASVTGGTANLLTGTGNHASTDAPFGSQQGYIFNAALNAGKTVRNYGFLVNNIGPICTNTTSSTTCKATPIKTPFASSVIQVAPLEPSLVAFTDVYFRGYDQNYPDVWRYNEWKREFDQFDSANTLPSLSLVRISHDHMGSFGSALGGFSTPETQQAECDYATGKIVEAVAKSLNYSANTLIIITEDDVQDGPDHIDSHRAPAFVVGPYVKNRAVVSTSFNQVSALRTIEDILGTQHINLYTAFQRPMADAFDINSSGNWNYTALASTYLNGTVLALAKDDKVRFAEGPKLKPKHNAAYWDKAMAGFDFTEADNVPTGPFNN